MSYINVATSEYPLTAAEIIERHKSVVSFCVPFEPPPGYAEVKESAPPAYNPLTHHAVEKPPKLLGGMWMQAWAIQKLDETGKQSAFSAAKASLKSRVSAHRKKIQACGVTLSVGQSFSAEECDALRSILSSGAPKSIDFKSSSGWLCLTCEQVSEACAQAARHTQECFSAQRAHETAIDALETAAAIKGYNILAGWPDIAKQGGI